MMTRVTFSLGRRWSTQFRGLGGELLPQHMVDLYTKQFDVWDQVSRRSSLSALSLAATLPR